jgi:RNA polymerase sigma-70 factor, ECF subfamily
MMTETLDRPSVFQQHRARLFGIAYRMLGSVEDAEDLVQETYLRWHEADTTSVRSPEAWLVAVVSRLSIDRLRRASSERQAYVGSWLPEPLTYSEQPATDRETELASDLSMAFLMLLERLAPEERGAFLLRDVFETEYDEIARVLGKSEDATRQIVSRARSRVQRDRPRFDVPPDAKERLLERFLAALRADDQQGVLALLSPDVSLTADGGGKVFAARKVIRDRAKIARMLIVIERKRTVWEHRLAMVNGEPAIVTFVGDRIVSTTSIEIDGERIVAFLRVLNPDKLRRIQPRV